MKRALVPSFVATAPRSIARRLPLIVRRNPRRWAGGALLLLAIMAAATCRFGRTGKKDAYREYTVIRGDLTVTVSSPGTVSPQNRIELKPPLAGRLDQVLVREGDEVKKGQVLAWISPSERAALLDAARAKGPDEVAKWEDAYKAAPLVAPLPGFIIARKAEPGQTLGSNDAPLIMADRLIVRAQVDETDMSRVKVGQDAEITLDAYPGTRIPARVDHLAYEASSANNVTVYDIEVALLKESRILRSGMTATAIITVTRRRNAVLVPAEALMDSQGGLAVMVKGKGGKRRPATVVTGASDGSQVEITSGLAEKDVILIPLKAISAASAQSGSPLSGGGGRRR